MQSSINPFYAARQYRPASEPDGRAHQPIYARLPRAPVNASPVPHLTSLYHFDRAGEYGDRGYPGNCGGNLIKDLLLYFQPRIVCDPMAGSGTCRDVCEELAHPLHVVGHPRRLRRLRPASVRTRTRRSISFGRIPPTGGRSSIRRSARPVPRPDAGGLLAALRPVHSQLRQVH